MGIIVMRGLPGSGKSTWAQQAATETGSIIVSRDQIRQDLFNQAGRLTHEQEQVVSNVEEQLVSTYLNAGKQVIIDAMHLRPKYIRKWYKFTNDVSIQEMPVLSIEDLIARDADRGDKTVGESVIRVLHKRFTKNGKLHPAPPPPEKPLTYTYERVQNVPTKTHTVIVDLDGTLAHHDETNYRGHHDYHLVGNDYYNLDILKLVRLLKADGNKIVFVSGRPDSCRPETEHWLTLGGFFEGSYDLHMRATGDNRRDDVVKYEIFKEHIEPDHYIKYVLDDRNRVVNMWRALGFRTLQVAEGDF